MAAALLTRRYLTEYARRPINLALLVVVPIIFVTLAAGAIADFAEIIGMIVFLTTTVSLIVTAIDFTPASWVWFAVGSILVATAYGLVGVLVGVVFGRLGGLYVIFLLPFIDVGIAQNIMFSAAPPDWGLILPARGGVQVLVDGAFTPGFDQTGGLALAILWLILLGAATAAVFHRVASSERV